MEDILAHLPRHGTLLKDRAYRQVWRFTLGEKPYYLKFYPRRSLKHSVRGNPAMHEFRRLQQLQKAAIPAPRAANVLIGYRLGGRIGDAVVMEGIEPSMPLDQYLSDLELLGEPVPHRAELARQVVDIVEKLGRAGLRHTDLHLGNFLLSDEKVHLLDAYAVRFGGLRVKDVTYLGSSAARFATRSDLRRAWLQLGNDGPMPPRSTSTWRYWRKFVEAALGDNSRFGRIAIGDWSGHYFKKSKFALRWSASSGLSVTQADWEQAWPKLLAQIESGGLEKLKSSRSGDVYAAEVELAGNPLAVVVKRPYKRYWYRYVSEIGRSRSRRAWIKAWKLIARGIPTAWPLLMLEKRSLGYVTDSIIVMERVAGSTLASVDLNALPQGQRDMLLRRTGAILRRIDETGLGHFDAKASNWIVRADAVHGPGPILVDVDGIRSRRWIALGIERLLRSMRDHPQYTPADSLSLCRGYAPYSPLSAAGHS